MEPTELMQRARRAYELGRLRQAARVLWYVAPLVAASIGCCGQPLVSVLVGGALALVGVALLWRGQAWGAAVVPGLAAGAIPFAVMVLVKVGAAHFCSLGVCMDHCVRFCGGGGVAAGLLLAWQARRFDRDGARRFLIAGGAVATLTGLLGCFVGGLFGALGMVLGEAIATMPVIALQLRRD